MKRYFLIYVLLLSPLIQLRAQTTVQIDITKDAFVYFIQGGTVMESVYGPFYQWTNVSTGTSGGSPSASRCFMAIDLSSLPDGAIVSDAKLVLEMAAAWTATSGNTVVLHKTTQTWTESISWNSQPTFATAVDDPVIDASTATGWIDKVDITKWVSDEMANGSNELAFALKLQTEVPGTYHKREWGSAENNDTTIRPYAEITYYLNEQYLQASEAKNNTIYNMTSANLLVQTDDDFVFKSTSLTYEILDAFNAVKVSSTSSNLTANQNFLTIDLNSYALTANEQYEIILTNEEGHKRYLKFQP